MPLIVRFVDGQLVEVEGQHLLSPDERSELESYYGSAIADVVTLPLRAEGAEALAGRQWHPEQPAATDASLAPAAVAIVGLAGRFPGAANLAEFWGNLLAGVDPIGAIPADRWPLSGFYDADPHAPGRCTTRFGGFLSGVDLFDAEYFGISAREAELMDPQQRLLLEVAQETLDVAGYGGRAFWDSPTGVFIGASNLEYLHRFLGRPEQIERYLGSGNTLAMIANRLSYQFNFHGPSVAVDTACSASLVAVHEAVESLLGGQCDAALAGGVNLMFAPEMFINCSQARMLAGDGHCKTFDRAADGYVRSEGVGLVLLRRLEDALRDGDQIYAVIRGTAVNQDGRTNGLTAPNGPAQTALLSEAYRRAGVDLGTIQYVEAHGTGTSLGDPVELGALVDFFSGHLPRQSCPLGSVKTSVGHCESAAGIAALLKVVLALQAGRLPPHLHFHEPNPLLQLEESPFYVNDRPIAWPRAVGQPRRAGVSAFGFGGTNAHVVLEEAPAVHALASGGRKPPEESRERSSGGLRPPLASEGAARLLVLSARDEESLRNLCARFALHLDERPELNLHDVCAAAAVGRTHFPRRAAVVAATCDELVTQLRDLAAGRKAPLPADGSPAADLAARYMSGEAIVWAEVFGPFNKVSLPTYPHRRQRYWVDVAKHVDVQAPALEAAPEETGDPASWFYLPDWRPAPPARQRPLTEPMWLVFRESDGLGGDVAARLRDEGRGVIEIEPGAAFDPLDPFAYARLLDDLDSSSPSLAIVFAWGCQATATSDVRRTVHSLASLLQALDRRAAGEIRLWVVTSDAFAIGPGDAANPAAAAAASLAQVAARELSRVVVRAVDVSFQADSAAEAAANLWTEMHRDTEEVVIALRGPERLVRRLTPCDPRSATALPSFRDDGVYLITGGTGLIGRLLAAHLLRHHRASVTLCGRRQENDPQVQRVLTELRQELASAPLASGLWPLAYVSCDVADPDQVQELIATILARHRRLDGVIHAAGLMHDGLLCNRTPAEIDAVLRPKATGAWVLHEATRRLPLDCFVMCSSTAAIQGEPGHAVYAAASAALDALAQLRRAQGLPALSINWGPWEGTAAAASAAYQRIMHKRGSLLIPAADGVEALSLALAMRQPQITVIRMTRERRGNPLGLDGPLLETHELPATPWDQIAASAAAVSRSASASLDAARERYRGIGPRMDRLCAQYVVEAISALDGWQHLSAGVTAAELARRLHVVASLQPAFVRLLAMLVADGLLDLRDDKLSASQLPAGASADEQSGAIAHEFPAVVAQLEFLRRAGHALADILSGRRRVLEVLFPAGSATNAEAVYRDAPFAEYFRRVAAATVAACADAAPTERPLRVLEIGGGTGATTTDILPALVGRQAHYTFTDISPTLLRRAERELPRSVPLDVRRLDVEQDPEAQGFAAHAFDVVIAADVLHATSDIRTTLAHVVGLLAPGGVLVLLEATRALRFGELTFGLTEGWWRFRDADRRDAGPLLSLASWRRALAAAGFEEPVAFPELDLSAADYLDHHLLIARCADEATPSSSPGELTNRLRQIVAEITRTRPEALSTSTPFVDLGVDSLMVLEVLEAVRTQLGIAGLSPAVAFDHPTIEALAEFLATKPNATPPHESSGPRKPFESAGRARESLADAIAPSLKPAIAVVGYACRFPGAADAEEFWRLIRDGREAVGPIPAERRRLAGALAGASDTALPDRERGGFLADVDAFDAGFFRITPLEARYLDPRHRLFLEVAYQAAEHAGYGGHSLSRTNTGVFVGVGVNDYLAGQSTAEIAEFWATGSTPSTLPSRLAYFLDLQGPCVPVDTACSSSLVALHLAAQGLLRGECDTAFAGGVHLNLRLANFTAFRRVGALSASGHCRAFASDADGFVPSEGCGVVLLKRLDDALRDGDRIYGLIRATAINNDGRTNGLTAPSAAAQARVLAAAWRAADVEPRTLSYIETHGTGTPLGDPVEAEALAAAFRQFTADRQFCRIGSVKSNVGHCETAAGMAGLIKLLLCFEHESLPGLVHFNAPNRHVAFTETPLVPFDRAVPWPRDPGHPRRAGLSAFGFGGTNAHVVLEEPPAAHAQASSTGSGQASGGRGHRPRQRLVAPEVTTRDAAQLLILSARDVETLRALCGLYAAHLAAHPELDLHDVCATAAVGRLHLSQRIAVVAASRDELISQLERLSRGEAPRASSAGADSPLWHYAARYLAGETVAWQDVYPRHASVPLPTYPYQRRRYWLEGSPPPSANPKSKIQNPKSPDPFAPLETSDPRELAALQYELTWEPDPSTSSGQALSTGSGPAEIAPSTWLILESSEADAELAAALALRLPGDVRRAPLGEAATLARTSEGLRPPLAFVLLDTACPELVEGARGDETLSAEPRGSAQALVALAQELARASAAGRLKLTETQLLVITRAAQPAGGGPHDPAQGLLLGLALALPEELKGLSVRSVDLDEAALGAEDVLRELAPSTGSGQAEIVYRDGIRLARALRSRASQVAAPPWRTGGVYLITGGLGGIGRQLAEHLASRYQAQVVLCGRRSAETAGDFGFSILDFGLAETRGGTSEGLRPPLALERAPIYVSCDVSREDQVIALAETIQARYGRLDGLLHAAGVLDLQQMALRTKSWDSIRAVWAPKLQGSVSLIKHLVRRFNPEQVVLFSSIGCLSSALSAGESDYAAACRYQNHLAAWLRDNGVPQARAVLLSEWGQLGMLAQGPVGPIVRHLGLKPLTAETALAAFEQALSSRPGEIALLAGAATFNAQQVLTATTTAPLNPKSKIQNPKSPPLAPVPAEWLAQVQALVAEVLQIPLAELSPQTHLLDLGVDSILAVQLARTINARWGTALEPLVVFRQPSAAALAGHLWETWREGCERLLGRSDTAHPVSAGAAPARTSEGSRPPLAMENAIAVIGLACRFPGAENPAAFWANIRAGREAVGRWPAARWALLPSALRRFERGSPLWGGFIEGVELFDAALFGISPREAELIDPQQRLLLETALTACEAAGYGGKRRDGQTVGMFVGAGQNQYAALCGEQLAGAASALTASSGSMLANRVSYLLNLAGPSLSVDTACSSSLVALHLACQSLRSGECDLALVGGVNLLLDPRGMGLVAQGGFLAADGHVKAFDDRADGFVRGEGVAVVLLKPLQKALEDGDPIQAVIRGTATGNDGHAKAGLASPSPQAQARVIARAWQEAGCAPATAGLLEAHGTGTSLGDPVEVSALEEVFSRATHQKSFCALGSVKTNVGHLEAAAGMAGLLKAIYALREAELPPTLHVETPNRHLQLESSAFYLNDRLRSWPVSKEHPRRAGLSSFGLGGTNVHIVLEEPPAVSALASSTGSGQASGGRKPPEESRETTSGGLRPPLASAPAYALTLSAHTDRALRDWAAGYLARLNADADVELGPLCVAAAWGASRQRRRLSLVARSRDQLADKLQLFIHLPEQTEREGSLIFQAPSGNVAAWLESQALTRLKGLPAGAWASVHGWCAGEVYRRHAAATVVERSRSAAPSGFDGLSADQGAALVSALAALWSAGAEVDWPQVFGAPRWPGVTLPAYPLTRTRHWLPGSTAGSTLASGGRKPSEESRAGTSEGLRPPLAIESAAPDVTEYFYAPGWEPIAAPQASSLKPQAYLVVGADDARRAALVAALAAAGTEVQATTPADFAVNLTPQIERIVERIAGPEISSAAELAAAWEELSEGFLARVQQAAAQRSGRRWTLMTTAAQAVTEGESPSPLAAALWGFGRGLAREYPQDEFSFVDLPAESAAAEVLVAVLAQTGPLQVAWREGVWHVPVLRPQPPRAAAGPSIRAGGVYLITGGQGQIGLKLAGWLAEQAPALKLILANRTPHPECAEELERLRDAGAEVWPATVDVTDEADLFRLLHEIERRFGALDGVIHAAGSLADGMLDNRTPEERRGVSSAKLVGAWLLDRLTHSKNLDWLVVCSSLAACDPLAGQAAYAAANAAADAIVLARHAAGRRALAIDWGFWSSTSAVAPARYRQFILAAGIRGLSDREGCQAFGMALADGSPRWVVAGLGQAPGARRQASGQNEDPLHEALRAAAIEAQRPLEEDGPRIASGLEFLERRAAGYVARAFHEAGLFGETGAAHSLTRLSAALGLLPRFARLLPILVEMLVAEGFLEFELEETPPDTYRATEPLAEAAARLLGELPADDDAFRPYWGAALELLDRCGGELAAILAGRVDPLQRLFADGDAAAAEALYRDAPLSQYYTRLVRTALKEIVAQRSTEERPLKILEVGAGTGGTTQGVLDVLPPDRTEYLASDLSRGLVRRLAETLAANPKYSFLKTQVLDLELDPESQGLAPHTFDVIIAANVLHATRNLGQTLAHVRRLLAPGGRLIAVEATGVARWGWLTFGLTEGWWRFEDRPLRTTSPLISAPAWQRLLQEQGFRGGADVLALPESEPGIPAPVTQHFLLAQTTFTVASEGLRPPLAWDLAPAIATVFAETLRLPGGRMDVDGAFEEQGLDSLLALEALSALATRLGLPRLSPTLVFEHPTPQRLADHLAAQYAAQLPSLASGGRGHRPRQRLVAPEVAARDATARERTSGGLRPPLASARDAVAVIGYALRFPGASSAAEYWQLLSEGRDCVAAAPPERVRLAGLTSAAGEGGFLADIDLFDAGLFRILPAEAEALDPRQRLFLEVAYECLEQAGYGGSRLAGSKTGVFVGAGSQDYLAALAPQGSSNAYWATSGSPSILASRLAYFLDLQGPCLPIDTACSSSLVAVHLAVESLRRGECTTAVAGGVHLNLWLANFAAFREMGALAPGGRCRAFDERADGFVPSEGCAVVLLKPLDKAIQDGDTVYGLIRGTATGNDGRTNGLTAPNPQAQRDCLLSAWQDAQVDPTTISYLEAHGTGTALGDPVEVEGIAQAFARHTPRKQFVRLGAVKSNLGHCETAAGMAGLIKLLLCFEHESLPGLVHFNAPNRHVAFTETPLVPLDRAVPWPRDPGHPRRAGLSAFGFGGTNAHVVLEEPPAAHAQASSTGSGQASGGRGHRPRQRLVAPEVTTRDAAQLLILSARDVETLRALCGLYAAHLAAHPELDLHDVCATAAVGRLHLSQRIAVVAASRDELISQLERLSRGEAPRASSAGADSPLWHYAARYLAGETVAWQDVYPRHASVPLPTYPYQRRRYWLEGSPPPSANPKSKIQNPKSPDPFAPLETSDPRELAALQYELTWEPDPSTSSGQALSTGSGPAEIAPSTWLILESSEADAELAAALALRLPGDVRRAPLGEAATLARTSEGLRPPLAFVLLDTACPELVEGARGDETLSAEPRGSAQALVALAQELARASAAGRLKLTETQLLVITRAAQPAGGGPHDPAQGLLLGLALALPEELKGLSVRSVDLDEAALGAEDVLRELAPSTGSGQAEIVYRDGIRLARALRSRASQVAAPPWRTGGVYLITGGLGGIGRQLAEHLASRYQAQVVLCGRRSAETAGDFGFSILDFGLAETRGGTSEGLRPPLALERAPIYVSCDVSREDQVIALAETIQARYGRLDGLLHAAGVLDLQQMALRTKSWDSIRAVWAPKLQGSVSLIKHLVRRFNPEQVVLFSSIGCLSSALSAGESDYAAACRYQNHLAAWLRDNGVPQARAVLLSEWGQLGMLAQGPVGPIVRHLGLKPLTAETALAAFEQALSSRPGEIALLAGAATFNAQQVLTATTTAPLNPKSKIQNPKSPTLALETVPTAVAQQAAEGATDLQKIFATAAGGDRALQRLAALYAARLLDEAQFAHGQACTAPQFIASLKILPRYGRLAERLLAMLVEESWLEARGEQFVVAVDVPEMLHEIEPLSEKIRATWPHLVPALTMLTRCGGQLSDVLRGHVEPTAALFPDGSTADAQAVYEETPLARYFNSLPQAALRAILAQAPAHSTLNIIEIGAGTGATTAALLPLLSVPSAPPRETSYVFTDLSAGFLNAAEARFAAHPQVRYQVLDIERSPAAQGFTKHTFDVVVATNVLHATRSLRETLAHVAQLLKPGGWLLLGETTQPWRWVDLTFGLTAGWWRFADHDLRTAGPLLSAAAWQRLLEAEGFPEVSVFPTPETPSGQHFLLAQLPEAVPPQPEACRLAPETSAWLHNLFARQLRLDPSELDETAHLMDLGFDSILALQIRRELQTTLGIELEPTLLFRHGTIATLAQHLTAAHPQALARLLGQPEQLPRTSEGSRPPLASAATPREKTSEGSRPPLAMENAIAVIGLACRFPGAENPAAFWANIRAGREAVGRWPAARWALLPSALRRFERGSPLWGGFIEGVELFDAALFGISPREAELIDPQQRLLLETALTACEAAGYGGKRRDGQTVGMFVGAGQNQYAALCGEQLAGAASALTASSGSMLANRVSYLLNLAGPSLSVDTACSSSLVALHLACQSLRSGECDLALVGGVNLLLDPRGMGLVAQGGFLAADGHVKAFDDRADGFVRGEGVAVVLLKPLQKALEDGDPIQAVIRGTATGNDGHAKAGLASPSPQAQARVIARAWQEAGCAPATAGLFEAHGTGTSLGDPVEVSALEEVFSRATHQKSFCALGSVKTNVGHLEAAAGMAGLLKAIYALREAELPPTLHVETPNRHLQLESSAFYLNDRLRSWPVSKEHPRRAGLSSFGLGGTNVHVVLEEPPALSEESWLSEESSGGLRPPLARTSAYALTLSAHMDCALRELAGAFVEKLESAPELELADICYSANTGYALRKHRLAVVATDNGDLCASLRRFVSDGDPSATAIVRSQTAPGVGWLFPGLGSQYVGMGRSLFDADSGVRNHLKRLDDFARRAGLPSILDALFPSHDRTAPVDGELEAGLALVSLELALAAHWRSWGIQPAAVGGYSVGVYAAACAAGVVTEEEALRLVAARRSPDFGEVLSGIRTAKSRCAWFSASGATVTNVPGEGVVTLRESGAVPDDPGAIVAAMAKLGCRQLIEVGPNTGLTSINRLVSGPAPALDDVAGWPSLRPGDVDRISLLKALSGLYLGGVGVDWEAVDRQGPRRRVEAPAYPFQRERFWPEFAAADEDVFESSISAVEPRRWADLSETVPVYPHPLLGDRIDDEWSPSIAELDVQLGLARGTPV